MPREYVRVIILGSDIPRVAATGVQWGNVPQWISAGAPFGLTLRTLRRFVSGEVIDKQTNADKQN